MNLVTSKINETFVQECKLRLLQARADIINRVRESRSLFDNMDRGGDEADQTMSLLAENEFLSSQQRLKEQLIEIDSALGRIEQGRYGVCEETDEPIEIERLRALPWTRLSIEGAEIREAVSKRYVRTGV